MNYLHEDQLEEQGTFVFQVLEKVFVRSLPSLERRNETDLCFEDGELVAIDLIVPSASSRTGPFLRLADGAGWLYEFKDCRCTMQRLPVISNMLWTMYADNCPGGQPLRRHPVDRDDLAMKPDVVYRPMRKLYCDKKVLSPDTGVAFYRVQGTNGWVFDKRMKNEGDTAGHQQYVSMLLPESHVKLGFFAYRTLGHLAARTRTDLNDSSPMTTIFEAGQIVIADVIRNEPGHKEGPYVRLADGSGWLCCKTEDGKLLEEVPIETGRWKLKVASEVPVRLLRQPIDREDMLSGLSVVLKKSEKIECDQRMEGADGVTFYRAKGTNGYVLDKRSGQPIMQLVKSGDNDNLLEKTGEHEEMQGWTPGFVRGIASLVTGTDEVAYDETNKVLTFGVANADGAMVMVFYATRSVGIALKRPVLGRTQYLRKNCNPSDLKKILRSPQKQMEEYCPDDDESCSLSTRSLGSIVFVKEQQSEEQEQNEEDMRQQLVDYEEKMQQLKRERLALLKSLKAYDDTRALVERKVQEREEQREKERQEALERSKIEQNKKRRDSLDRTCKECSCTLQKCIITA